MTSARVQMRVAATVDVLDELCSLADNKTKTLVAQRDKDPILIRYEASLHTTERAVAEYSDQTRQASSSATSYTAAPLASPASVRVSEEDIQRVVLISNPVAKAIVDNYARPSDVAVLSDQALPEAWFESHDPFRQVAGFLKSPSLLSENGTHNSGNYSYDNMVKFTHLHRRCYLCGENYTWLQATLCRRAGLQMSELAKETFHVKSNTSRIWFTHMQSIAEARDMYEKWAAIETKPSRITAITMETVYSSAPSNVSSSNFANITASDTYEAMRGYHGPIDDRVYSRAKLISNMAHAPATRVVKVQQDLGITDLSILYRRGVHYHKFPQVTQLAFAVPSSVFHLSRVRTRFQDQSKLAHWTAREDMKQFLTRFDGNLVTLSIDSFSEMMRLRSVAFLPGNTRVPLDLLEIYHRCIQTNVSALDMRWFPRFGKADLPIEERLFTPFVVVTRACFLASNNSV